VSLRIANLAVGPGRLVLILGLGAGGLLRAQIDTHFHVRIPMRDGVNLSANIFRPLATGRWPVLLVRTPYDKGSVLTPHFRAFVEHGFALVVQDVRGRYESEGLFRPLVQEGPDGEDTLNWIGHEAWCDGKIGMFGGSYSGIAQWQAALRNSPYLKAIFPVVSGYDDYFDRFYSRGGAMKLGHRLLWISENLRAPGFVRPDLNHFIWHLPLRTADFTVSGEGIDFYQRSLNHPSYDDFWRSLSTREKLDRIRVPVFSVGGWFDNYGQSDLEAFATLRKLGRPAYVMVGPWAHNSAERLAVDFGPESVVPLRRIQFKWFDHWLKGQDTIQQFAPARIFTMGENRWDNEEMWPLPNARVEEFYLAGKGNAETLNGDGKLQLKRSRHEAADPYIYDPHKPVPTRGGAICCNAKILPPGPMDQRPIEGRHDILVFTSHTLKADLQVTGVVRALLYVSTSARDTDFTAKLIDVAPDGTALGLTDGILRLRYRGGVERPELAKPGEIYQINIDAGPTSNVFRQGHRIRLEIASSNFPRFDRNPNTGRPVADETELRIARQTVYHGGRYPSALMLPVVIRPGVSASTRRPVDTGLSARRP
jgi:predicted acyl esterase